MQCEVQHSVGSTRFAIMPNLTFTHLSIQTNNGFFTRSTTTKIGNGGASLDSGYLLLSLDKRSHPHVNVCLFLSLDASPSSRPQDMSRRWSNLSRDIIKEVRPLSAIVLMPGSWIQLIIVLQRNALHPLTCKTLYAHVLHLRIKTNNTYKALSCTRGGTAVTITLELAEGSGFHAGGIKVT